MQTPRQLVHMLTSDVFLFYVQEQALSTGMTVPTARPLPEATLLSVAPAEVLAEGPDIDDGRSDENWAQRNRTTLLIAGGVLACLFLAAACMAYMRWCCCCCVVSRGSSGLLSEYKVSLLILCCSLLWLLMCLLLISSRKNSASFVFFTHRSV